MKTLYLENDLNIKGRLKVGFVDLYDRGGHKHRHTALEVPGYGLVPCARKLENDFSNETKGLVLVINEEDDKDKPFSSHIWISRSSVDVWDDLEKDNDENCIAQEDNQNNKLDEEFEQFLSTLDDIKEIADLSIHHYSLSMEEYCEKYKLDISKASETEDEIAIIIPYRKGKKHKKIALDERMTVLGGCLIDLEQIQFYRVYDVKYGNADAYMLDADWFLNFFY